MRGLEFGVEGELPLALPGMIWSLAACGWADALPQASWEGKWWIKQTQVFLYREKYLTLRSNRFPPSPPNQTTRYQINYAIAELVSLFCFWQPTLTSNILFSFKARELQFCMKTAWINTEILPLLYWHKASMDVFLDPKLKKRDGNYSLEINCWCLAWLFYNKNVF